MMRRRWLGIVLIWVAAVLVASIMATSAAAAGPVVQYIVHPGDTLYRIALNHHVTVSQLAAANGIRNVNRIYVGQVLRIPSAAPAIILEQPVTGARVTSPVTVRGRGNVFEGQVNIRVLDSRFRKVGEGFGMAAMGEYAPFTAEVAYRVSADQWGYIDAFWISPKDGAELDKVTVKVYLRRSGVAPTPTPTPTPGPGASIRYHVHPGDTLTQIARGHRVTVASLVRENHLPNPNLIYVGQALTISSERPNIIMETPRDGAAVGNPAVVSGYSDTFEANVVVEVLDGGFRRLARTTTQGGTQGEYGPFTASIPYTVRAAQWGYVEAYWPSPQDGSKLSAVTARVRLTPATTAAATTATTATEATTTETAAATAVITVATTAAATLPPANIAMTTASATTEPAAPRIHRVRRGDTLYSIARRYGVSVRAIAAANGIRNIHLIYVGQRLIIP